MFSGRDLIILNSVLRFPAFYPGLAQSVTPFLCTFSVREVLRTHTLALSSVQVVYHSSGKSVPHYTNGHSQLQSVLRISRSMTSVQSRLHLFELMSTRSPSFS